MQASVQFDHSLTYEQCKVSSQIFAQWPSSKVQPFAEVTLPNYDPLEPQTAIVHVTLDESLRDNTIRLDAKIFGIKPYGPAVNFCQIKVLEKGPKVLDTVVITLNDCLYDNLMKLHQHEDKLLFLKIKYGLFSARTVVRRGLSLAPSMCIISYCAPHSQGLLDFERTQIIFVRDKNSVIQNPAKINKEISRLTLSQTKNLNVRLRCLQYVVKAEMIKPIPGLMEDDTIYAFATFETLIQLGVASGSYIKIRNDSTSRVIKLFVVTSPHHFQDKLIYAHPRVIANFPDDEEVFVEKYSIKEAEIQTASSVSIARVGCWDQSQKGFQNIILNNLKYFLTSRRRILRIGDMIPISFDSTLAALCADDFKSNLPFKKDDRLVWFYVESFSLEGENNTDSAPEFIIDENKTKLVTANIVSRKPLEISRCDYISYYGLKSTFHYNQLNFPYAKRLVDILTSYMKNHQKNLPMSTSIMLFSSSINTGKSTLVEFAALNLGLHLLEIDCTSLTTTAGSIDSTTKVLGYLRGKLEGVIPHAKPAIVFISHLDVILGKNDQGQDPESSKITKTMDVEIAKLIQEMSAPKNETIFIGSVNDIDSLPQKVRNSVKFEIEISIPTENQRKDIFKWLLAPHQLNNPPTAHECHFSLEENVSIPNLALQSAGLTPLDMKKTVENAKYSCLLRSLGNDLSTASELDTLFITMKDLAFAISKTRDEFSVSIGAPKIPRVTWEDIGGMDVVQGEIMDTIEMPLKHPELFASGMKKRSGILFYGPPGTGKTLMAKAIATNFSLNFFSVKGPELLNMYIGESEANVRRVFQKARDAKPCVIFFDELDSVAPKRGNQGDSGGVMDRIVSQLLAELDSMGSEGDGVYVIGATNRPDLLDEALLRPGRFDKLLYLGISDTDEKQLNILEALTRKFALADDVNLMSVAKNCPFTYTGADFYALCSDAMLNAMSRIAEEVESKLKEYNMLHQTSVSVRYWFDRLATEQDTLVTVKMVDFMKAQRELMPSVSEDELNHYLRIKATFEES